MRERKVARFDWAIKRLLRHKADAPGLREAVEELEIACLPIEEQEAYSQYIRNMESMKHIVSDAWDCGVFEGKKEGMAEGQEKGLTEADISSL